MNRKEKRQRKKVVESEIPKSFQLNYNLHRPWADLLFETELPPAVLDKMIEISDTVLADSKRTNWGNNLAGQIKEEPLIPPKVLNESRLTDFFGNMVQEYVHQCNIQKKQSVATLSDIEDIKNQIQVSVNSIWIVEQQPGEYNPIHVHTNCDVSAVMFLKVPTFLDSEKPERGDDGVIYFIGDAGVNNNLKLNTIKVNPKPGQFFIFPSHMIHTVYPYKTNDNFARRSVSFNASFEYKK